MGNVREVVVAVIGPGRHCGDLENPLSHVTDVVAGRFSYRFACAVYRASGGLVECVYQRDRIVASTDKNNSDCIGVQSTVNRTGSVIYGHGSSKKN